MSSLVEELQRDALNEQVKVTTLLRKSLVVAQKLRLNKFEKWINLELNGYGSEEIPDYRIFQGEPQAFNSLLGDYQTIQFKDEKIFKLCSEMEFDTPIGQIEHNLSKADKSRLGIFRASYPHKKEKELWEGVGSQPSLRINESNFQGVLDAVRNIILKWALELESKGITGEGLSFSNEEKQIAQKITYNVKTLIQGEIKDSQLQIESPNSKQINSVGNDTEKLMELVKALKDSINIVGLDEKAKEELKLEISNLETQIKTPENTSLIKESISSVRRILEGASGGMISSAIIENIDKILGVFL